jgi:ring-1,2-phenylacetyl-CoA epoxidase subunit PaaE
LTISSHTSYFALAVDGGIAPLVPLARDILENEPESRVTFVYGSVDASNVSLREELHDLKDRYLARFALHVRGRIDRANVDALLDGWIDTASIDVAFVSGPDDTTEAAIASLAAHGLPRERIETGRFAPGLRTALRPPAAGSPDATAVRASARLDGRLHAFAIDREGETILDAGLRQGLDLPYSCKGGVCSTCRVLLVEGAVDMEVHYALEDDEIARGFILMCQSYPRTDTIAIEVDSHGLG